MGADLPVPTEAAEARGHCAGTAPGTAALTSRGCFLIWKARWQESEGQAEAVGSSIVSVAMEKRAWDFSGEKN